MSRFGAIRSKHPCKRVLHMITQRVDIQTLPLATTAGDRSPITAVANSITESQTLVCCYWGRSLVLRREPGINRYTKGIWLSVILSVPTIVYELFKHYMQKLYPNHFATKRNHETLFVLQSNHHLKSQNKSGVQRSYFNPDVVQSLNQTLQTNLFMFSCVLKGPWWLTNFFKHFMQHFFPNHFATKLKHGNIMVFVLLVILKWQIRT